MILAVRLTPEQGRVIACLIEKQLTTPQQYPLTLNALVLACNQSSNRDPVVSYEEGAVQHTLSSLKEIGLVRFVYPSSGRSATRYRQVLGEALGLDEKELAVLAVLLLRGPQTAGELRIRTERMATFDGLGAIANELDRLATKAEALVLQLDRRPGQKEERWVQLLTPFNPMDEVSGTQATEPYNAGEPRPAGGPRFDGPAFEHRPAVGADLRLVELAEELAQLREELTQLRAVVEQLQADYRSG
jgi:uncharacterized protein YceH (UPF0502 family)